MGQGPQSAARGHEARAQELLDPGRHRAGSDIRLPGHGLVHCRDAVFDPGHRPQLPDLHLTGDPVQQEVTNTYALPSLQHPLGTDVLGRDQLSRILYGASISLTIGMVVQFLILIIGGVIGMVAGYFGGWIDNLLMRFTDIMYAFPDLLLVLVFVAAFGPSFWSIFIALGLVYWVGLARLVRGQVLSIKE